MRRQRQTFLVRATFRFSPQSSEFVSAFDVKDAIRIGRKNNRGADKITVLDRSGQHVLMEVEA